MRPELHEGALAQGRQLLPRCVDEVRPGIDDLDVVATLEDVGDDEAGLVEVGAARRIADEATRGSGLDARGEQLALETGEGRDIGGAASPACLGAAAQRAETGARG